MSGPLIILRSTESVHWYAQDGSPRYDATLREARKEHLYPSVTNILDLKNKPALNNWRLAGMIAQALTLPRLENEPDESYIERIRLADEAERAKAPDLGAAVHRAIAARIKGESANGEAVAEALADQAMAWLRSVDWQPLDSRAEETFTDVLHGYGGSVDLIATIAGRLTIVDWKTQAVKEKPKAYDEWCWQLAAYGRAFPLVEATVNVVLDTTGSVVPWPKWWTDEEDKWAWRGFQGLAEAWFADRKYDLRH